MSRRFVSFLVSAYLRSSNETHVHDPYHARSGRQVFHFHSPAVPHCLSPGIPLHLPLPRLGRTGADHLDVFLLLVDGDFRTFRLFDLLFDGHLELVNRGAVFRNEALVRGVGGCVVLLGFLVLSVSKRQEETESRDKVRWVSDGAPSLEFATNLLGLASTPVLR